MAQDNRSSLADARAQALGKHQTALALARTTFDAAVAAIDLEHNACARIAEQLWDEVKSNIDHPSIHIIRVEYERSLVPPSYDPARHALAEAVSKADADYQQELDRIAAEHGVVIRRFA
jgi:hypothetical protein